MSKVYMTLRELEDLKTEVTATFAERREPLYNLMITVYTSYLKRRGIDVELEIEEEPDYE